MRKLTLSKKTISSLNNLEMGVIKGGTNYCGTGSGGSGSAPSYNCPPTSDYCTVSAPSWDCGYTTGSEGCTGGGGNTGGSEACITTTVQTNI